MNKKTLLIILIFFTAFSLFGQSSSADDRYEIKLAVIGPGDELYFWWGHIGLLIKDSRTGSERFYDWGIFSFDNENFFVNFAFGRLIYTCGSSPSEWNFLHYLNTNRDITLYTLDLPPEKKEEILRYAEWNIQPENKDYFYHHFDDNCATRIRDILDMALNGQFSERYGEMPGRYTFRQHVRRHTWFNPFCDWMLCFLMGKGIDRPVTVWEEMFLPAEIGNRADEFYYTAPDGSQKKLVSKIEVLNRAVKRPIVLDVPRRQWPRELAAGCLIALIFALLLFYKEKKKPAAVCWALGQGILGFFFGFMGLILFFMTFFTNHDYTYNNINVLFVNPLLLAALPFGIGFVRQKTPEARRKREILIKALWTYVFAFGLISILINALPSMRQQNWVDLALIMPPAAVLSLITFKGQLHKPVSDSQADKQSRRR